MAQPDAANNKLNLSPHGHEGARGGAFGWGTALQADSIPESVTGIFHWQSFRPPWGRLSLWQKWVPGICPGRKGSRCLGLTILSPLCANCLEIWEPQPSETVWACNKPVQGLPYLYPYHGHEQILLVAWCLVLYVTDKNITSKNKSVFWGIYSLFLGIPCYTYCIQEHEELVGPEPDTV